LHLVALSTHTILVVEPDYGFGIKTEIRSYLIIQNKFVYQ
jgi:hypothetical protein